MAKNNLGQIFIVAAPSGGGKTSLVSALVDALSDIQVSISHTTRDKRQGERDGDHYHFIDESKFLNMVKQHDFVEHAEVFGHWYGTSKRAIQSNLSQGIDIILDIDWQGASQIKASYPQAASIFVMPPSLDALAQRLNARKRESAQVIAQRMECARDEMSHFQSFDYLIINDHFEDALSQLKAIVISERLKLSRQIKKQHNLLSILLSSK